MFLKIEAGQVKLPSFAFAGSLSPAKDKNRTSVEHCVMKSMSRSSSLSDICEEAEYDDKNTGKDGKNVATTMSNELTEFSNTDDVKEKISVEEVERDKNLSLSATPKVHKPKRKVTSNKSYTFNNIDSNDESEFGGTDADEDDATVLLEKLKKEHELCSLKFEKLQEKNEKLTMDLKIYKKEMTKKREALAALKNELEDLKSLNFSLQRQLLKKSSG